MEARLLVACPDRHGIVAAVSGFLFEHGANIISSDQHSTDPEGGMFFMRMAFTGQEPIDALRRNHILLDGKDDKYMLQIFMKDANVMYGDEKAGPFFYEIIQREGDKGFGYGNFRALFESIESQQRLESSALEVVG